MKLMKYYLKNPIHQKNNYTEEVLEALQLLFANQTFDYVISTLVFCTIPNPEAALKEMIRVSKPNATFYFFEHVKIDNSILAKTQDLLTPLWKGVCDGF